LEWYELTGLVDRVSVIEQFLVEIAANEERIALNGFRFALMLPSYEAASKALQTFQEDFSNTRRLMARMDKGFFSELESLESSGKVIEELALINLQLRMAQAKTAGAAGISALTRSLSLIPYFSKLVVAKPLFGAAQISLQRTIINVGRLRTTISMFAEYAANRKIEDDEIFKPSNISTDRVVGLIDKAIDELDSTISLPEKEIDRLRSYLVEAKKEALSPKPSWSKVVGALVIVAAVTSGLADAPGAAKTVREAIEYVLGTSLSKPLQQLLPEPKQYQTPSPAPAPNGVA
jgi:hypothetical protein